VPVTAIKNPGVAATGEIIQGTEMSRREIFHVDIVSDAGPIRRVVIRAVDRHRLTLAAGSFTGHLDQMSRLRRGLTKNSIAMSARHVELPQRHITQRIGLTAALRHILQGPFGDELGSAIGIDGIWGGGL